MPESGSESPVSAALTGYPADRVNVLGVRVRDDLAVVLLDTRPSGPSYLYESLCSRGEDGRWYEDRSGNGPGWHATDVKGELGVTTLWGEVPADVDRVRVALGDSVHEEAVEGGAYLAVWWDTPALEFEWPRLIGIQRRGKWSTE